MRRKDREILDINDILSIIDKCSVMRVGFVDGTRPYIVPLNFGIVMDDDKLSIYFHCSREGRKIDLIKNNNQVCFEVDCSARITTGETACEWSSEYESVIGYGTIEIVKDEIEKIFGMNRIMGKYGFTGVPNYESNVFSRTSILKLTVEEFTGKRNIEK